MAWGAFAVSDKAAEDVLAVIIGRAGSKGLAGKNGRVIAGRPMVTHTIEAAAAAASVDRILVSTDGEAIARAARDRGVEVIDRPIDLAGDNATVDAAVRHAVYASSSCAALIVILYANVPVRPAGLIDQAVRTLRATHADSVQSYSEVGKHHPYWMVTLDGSGAVSPWTPNTVYRRQDLPPAYIPDGGVIAVTRASLQTVVDGQPHAFLGKDRRGIVSPGPVVDVDTAVDLDVAEAQLLRNRTEVGAATDAMLESVEGRM